MMRAIAGPGGRAQMHCSGIGKAILSTLESTEADKIIASLEMRRETNNTILTADDFRRELAVVRERGYAVDNEEYAVGLRCVASAVYDEHGTPLAGLSISGPTARLTDQRIPVLGQAVAAIATEITSELGGRRPPLR
jgi:IclR family acetate operon transcriptional repressor